MEIVKHESLPLPEWWTPGARDKTVRWFVDALGDLVMGPCTCRGGNFNFMRWEGCWVWRYSDPQHDWQEITTEQAAQEYPGSLGNGRKALGLEDE